MNKITLNKQNAKTIKTLAIIAIVAAILNKIGVFFRRKDIFLSVLEFLPFYIRKYIFGDIIFILPIVLWFIFIFYFQKGKYNINLLVMTFAFLAFRYFYYFVDGIEYLIQSQFDIISFEFLSDLIVAIFYGLSILNILQGLKSKLYVIISAIISISQSTILYIWYLIIFISNIDDTFMLISILDLISGMILSVAFNVSIFLFVLKNKIPVKIKSSLQKSPEKLLKTLNREFNTGKISEEEYNEKRTEIINNL